LDEFNRHNEEVLQFIKERYDTEPYNTDEVVKKIESLVRPEYMAIIKKTQ
jgi:hypothetical protein